MDFSRVSNYSAYFYGKIYSGGVNFMKRIIVIGCGGILSFLDFTIIADN